MVPARRASSDCSRVKRALAFIEEGSTAATPLVKRRAAAAAPVVGEAVAKCRAQGVIELADNKFNFSTVGFEDIEKAVGKSMSQAVGVDDLF